MGGSWWFLVREVYKKLRVLFRYFIHNKIGTKRFLSLALNISNLLSEFQHIKQ